MKQKFNIFSKANLAVITVSIVFAEVLLADVDVNLKNKPDKLFYSICGNGVVEPGEECDCKAPANCDNTCCNLQSCKFTENSVCATGSCCNLATCQPRLQGLRNSL